MNSPRGRYGLPPLTPLLVFESAARLRGFKAAADELEVTATARLRDWLIASATGDAADNGRCMS